MRRGGFPGRAACGLSLLLYSPDSHGEHIKCSPARAELAIDQSPRRALFLVAFGLQLANVALLVPFLIWRAGWADK